MSSRRRLVAVCGESDPQTSLAELAFQVGRGIALRDAGGLSQARNAILARTADGVVALGGGLRTLSEIALAVRNRRPAMGIRTWRFGRDARTEPVLPIAVNPTEALEWLFASMEHPS